MPVSATVHIETTGGCDLTIYEVSPGPKPATRAGVEARGTMAYLKGQGVTFGRVRVDLISVPENATRDQEDNPTRLKTWELDKLTDRFRQTR